MVIRKKTSTYFAETEAIKYFSFLSSAKRKFPARVRALVLGCGFKNFREQGADRRNNGIMAVVNLIFLFLPLLTWCC